MSDEDQTQFRFDFGGIELELSGERKFVEEMYQKVMNDVQEVRRRRGEVAAPGSEKAKKLKREKTPSVWVHRCSDMMRKIYMASQYEVGRSPLGNVVEVQALSNLYMDRSVFRHFFPDLEGGYTLWAEFTAVGRQKIAEATDPESKSLQQPSDSKP